MMKKYLVLMVMVGLVIPMVLGVSTSTFLETRDEASASLSALHDTSPDYSARLHAWSPSAGNEARVKITLPDDFTLNSLSRISWEQYVEQGYISHVDVILDIDGDGVRDDALVFEYAKVNPADCDDSADYPIDRQVNTFDDKGIVDDTAYAWLSSGPAGGCNSPATEFFWHSLSYWKNGPDPSEANGKTINSAVRVLALEFEVDAWIAESESFIDDIMLNGELIEDFENSQSINVEVITTITVMINPNILDFGSLVAGTIDNPAVNGPVSFDASGSNVDVQVEITDITAGLFEDGLKFDGALALGQIFVLNCLAGEVCTYDLETTDPTLDIPAGTPAGAKTGVITYTLTGAP